jgi:hypothetical protein
MDELKQFKNTFKEIVKDIVNTDKVYSNTKYQDNVSYQKRCEDSTRLCIKYPGYVPVIVNCFNPELQIKKNKFLVPKDISGSRLIVSIRSQLLLTSNIAVFMFIDNMLFEHSKTVGEIYEYYMYNKKDKNDKYMYVDITLENTFGNF